MRAIHFLVDSGHAKTAVGSWYEEAVAYYTIIILANMQGLSQDVYEAASIDGASRFQSFTRVTVPMLKPTLFFCVTLAKRSKNPHCHLAVRILYAPVGAAL